MSNKLFQGDLEAEILPTEMYFLELQALLSLQLKFDLPFLLTHIRRTSCQIFYNSRIIYHSLGYQVVFKYELHFF